MNTDKNVRMYEGSGTLEKHNNQHQSSRHLMMMKKNARRGLTINFTMGWERCDELKKKHGEINQNKILENKMYSQMKMK